MDPTKGTKVGSLQNTFSRRDFLKTAAALSAATSLPAAFGKPSTGAPPGTVWLYVSTYTGAPGLRGSSGMGIYLCELNLITGELTVLNLAAPVVAGPPSTASPSTIFIDPTGTHLYAGNEYGPPGAVSAYSINRLNGDLTLLNSQPAKGAPAYVGVDSKGKYLFSAEYSGSYFEVFPIMANGSLGPAVFEMLDTANVGPLTATDAPPGSFAISGHEARRTPPPDADGPLK